MGWRPWRGGAIEAQRVVRPAKPKLGRGTGRMNWGKIKGWQNRDGRAWAAIGARSGLALRLRAFHIDGFKPLRGANHMHIADAMTRRRKRGIRKQPRGDEKMEDTQGKPLSKRDTDWGLNNSFGTPRKA